jgi:hypothetical protein
MHKISRRSQLHNAHIDVNVGRVAVNKSKSCNHFDISLFRYLKSFSLFGFTFYVIDYLNSCFDHFITLFSHLNPLTMGVEVEFVYNVLNFCSLLYVQLVWLPNTNLSISYNTLITMVTKCKKNVYSLFLHIIHEPL